MAAILSINPTMHYNKPNINYFIYFHQSESELITFYI